MWRRWGVCDLKKKRRKSRDCACVSTTTYSGSSPFFRALCLSCCFCLSLSSLSCAVGQRARRGQQRRAKRKKRNKEWDQKNTSISTRWDQSQPIRSSQRISRTWKRKNSDGRFQLQSSLHGNVRGRGGGQTNPINDDMEREGGYQRTRGKRSTYSGSNPSLRAFCLFCCLCLSRNSFNYTRSGSGEEEGEGGRRL